VRAGSWSHQRCVGSKVPAIVASSPPLGHHLPAVDRSGDSHRLRPPLRASCLSKAARRR
jgi:hypothetical protein